MSGVKFSWSRFLMTAKKHLLFLATLAVFIIILINALGLALPKKYQSSAQVRIFSPRYHDLTGTSNDTLTIDDRLVTIREEMTSFQFLAQVAKITNIDAGLDPASPEYETLIRKIADAIDLHVKGRDLFTVSYINTSPDLAYKITDEIVRLYLLNSSHYYESLTGDRIKFIEQQLTQATARQEAAQQATLDYKNAHINEIPDAQDANQKRMEELRTEYLGVMQQLNALKDTLTLAKKKLETTDPEIVAEITENDNEGHLSELKNQRQQLEMALDMKLNTYTEEHWEVKDMRAQIKMLDDQIALAEDKKEQTITRTPNPAYQSLQDTITQTELEIQRFTTRSQSLSTDITKLEAYNDNVPKSQQALNQLESEQEFAETRVETLRAQLEDARLTSHLEQEGQGPTFQEMDPPRMPTAPISPNPKKIAAASVVMGFGAAGVLALLLTIFDTAVRTMQEARVILRMPVLGVVQRITTKAELKRQRRRKFIMAVGASAGLAIFVVALTLGLTVYRQPLIKQAQALRTLIDERLSP